MLVTIKLVTSSPPAMRDLRQLLQAGRLDEARAQPAERGGPWLLARLHDHPPNTFVFITTWQYLCQVNAIINTNMEKGMQNYNQTDYDGVTRTWDLIQREVCSLGYYW